MAQREALRRWCAANRVRLVAVFSDDGVSGGAAMERRPGLLAALTALRDLRAGVLLVARRDRLARDTMVAALAERIAQKNGAVVCTADGAGNGESPEAVLLRRVVDAFAEYERLLIRARTRDALAVKKARGERVGAIPYGYRLSADRVHIEVDRTEQRTMALARRYRRAGLSLAATGARLEAMGCLPRSSKRWHRYTVARIAGE